MHFWANNIVLSLVTDIVTRTYIKPTRMRFVYDQGVIELKTKTQGRTTSGKWRLPSLIMCMCSSKNISLRTKSSILTIVFDWLCSITRIRWKDYAYHLGKTAFPSLIHSCKEIRNASSHLEDGEYWIDLTRNGNLMKVYCDMTTERGKEGMFKKN